MKRALVLSGGGSRGSYEIGAWQALEEIGLRVQMCFGTSIGAINAALFLQGDLDLAVRLWDNMTAASVVKDAQNEQALQIERMFNRKRDLLAFLLEHARQLRMDIAPLEALLRAHIDEERVRAAGMDFGVVALKFPSLTPAVRTLRDIPQGQLIDWLLASSACFPVFPTRAIDGERYVDGGYYDNLPIDLALQQGAHEVVAVDVHPGGTHPEYEKMPFLTAVFPRRDLGNFLEFNPERLRKNRLLGYYDAMKAFGRFDGVFYTFARLNRLRAVTLGQRFSRLVSAFDAEAVRRGAIHADRYVAPLCGALTRGVREVRLDWTQTFLRGVELACALLGFAQTAIYDLDGLLARMLRCLEAEPDAVLNGLDDLIALEGRSDRHILACLYNALTLRGAFPGEWVEEICLFAEHAAAALCLWCARNL